MSNISNGNLFKYEIKKLNAINNQVSSYSYYCLRLSFVNHYFYHLVKNVSLQQTPSLVLVEHQFVPGRAAK